MNLHGNPNYPPGPSLLAQNAASRINNLYATHYMEVHSNAGPWGEKHDGDVSLIIEEAMRHRARHLLDIAKFIANENKGCNCTERDCCIGCQARGALAHFDL